MPMKSLQDLVITYLKNSKLNLSAFDFPPLMATIGEVVRHRARFHHEGYDLGIPLESVKTCIRSILDIEYLKDLDRQFTYLYFGNRVRVMNVLTYTWDLSIRYRTKLSPFIREYGPSTLGEKFYITTFLLDSKLINIRYWDFDGLWERPNSLELEIRLDIPKRLDGLLWDLIVKKPQKKWKVKIHDSLLLGALLL